MLDSERTFRIKVRLNWAVGQFPKFCLRQQLCAFKDFWMETRLFNIFKILPFFWHSNWHYFGYISRKVEKPHFLVKKKLKKLLEFGIFNESNIWAKVDHIWQISTIVEITDRRSCYFIHFINYHLDQLSSKHTKIAVRLVIQYFEGCSQKKCLLKVWRFLVLPPQNGGPVKFLQNWTKTII